MRGIGRTQLSMHKSLSHTMDAMSHSTNVNPSAVFHDRTRPFFTAEPGHPQTILPLFAGSNMEDEDTATSSNMKLI